ncbi:MAG: hypothetical protein ABIE42_09175 [Candidatus Eisenbacteria bacterium]
MSTVVQSLGTTIDPRRGIPEDVLARRHGGNSGTFLSAGVPSDVTERSAQDSSGQFLGDLIQILEGVTFFGDLGQIEATLFGADRYEDAGISGASSLSAFDGALGVTDGPFGVASPSVDAAQATVKRVEVKLTQRVTVAKKAATQKQSYLARVKQLDTQIAKLSGSPTKNSSAILRLDAARAAAAGRAVRYAKLQVLATQMARNNKMQVILGKTYAAAPASGDGATAQVAAAGFKFIGKANLATKVVRAKQKVAWAAATAKERIVVAQRWRAGLTEDIKKAMRAGRPQEAAVMRETVAKLKQRESTERHNATMADCAMAKIRNRAARKTPQSLVEKKAAGAPVTASATGLGFKINVEDLKKELDIAVKPLEDKARAEIAKLEKTATTLAASTSCKLASNPLLQQKVADLLGKGTPSAATIMVAKRVLIAAGCTASEVSKLLPKAEKPAKKKKKKKEKKEKKEKKKKEKKKADAKAKEEAAGKGTYLSIAAVVAAALLLL